jgi:hypothetical protein
VTVSLASSCTLSEPGCAVKEAVENSIPQFRYENYLQFCEEIKNKKKNIKGGHDENSTFSFNC